MEHSLWKVRAVRVVGRDFYQAYRTIDTSKPYSEENRETRGGYYYRKSDAVMLARRLNAEEAVK